MSAGRLGSVDCRQTATGITGQTRLEELSSGQASCSERRDPLTLCSNGTYDVSKHLAASCDVPKSEATGIPYGRSDIDGLQQRSRRSGSPCFTMDMRAATKPLLTLRVHDAARRQVRVGDKGHNGYVSRASSRVAYPHLGSCGNGRCRKAQFPPRTGWAAMRRGGHGRLGPAVMAMPQRTHLGGPWTAPSLSRLGQQSLAARGGSGWSISISSLSTGRLKSGCHAVPLSSTDDTEPDAVRQIPEILRLKLTPESSLRYGSDEPTRVSSRLWFSRQWQGGWILPSRVAVTAWRCRWSKLR